MKERTKTSMTAMIGGSILAALLLFGCPKITGNDEVADEQRRTNEILTAPKTDPCDENPQGQGCADQRNVEVGLECLPSPTVAMSFNCTATASSFASWYVWNCGSAGSPAPQRGQSDKTCIFTAPVPAARIGVVACEFEKQDDHCDSAEQVVAVLAPMTGNEGAAMTGDGLEFPGGGG